MIWILVKRHRAIHAPESNNSQLSAEQINMTKTMILVAVVFVICLLPFQTFYLVYEVKPLDADDMSVNEIYVWLAVISLTNCCINPFIYAVKYGAFKTGIKRMFGKTNKGPSDSVTMTSVTMETGIVN